MPLPSLPYLFLSPLPAGFSDGIFDESYERDFISVSQSIDRIVCPCFLPGGFYLFDESTKAKLKESFVLISRGNQSARIWGNETYKKK